MAQRRHRQRYEYAGHGRYLTFSCYQRLPLFANQRIKDAFAAQLEESRKREAFKLLAWVVMPEHVHLLLIPAEGRTVSQLLQAVKEPVARAIIARWRQLQAPILERLIDSRGSTHFWQRGGGHDHNIITPSRLIEKIQYIHANPVRRNLVATELDWQWSSARWYAGDRTSPVQIDPFTP